MALTMGPHKDSIRVTIDPACIACDICQMICPSVFVQTRDGCRLKPQAQAPEFLEAHRGAIEQAATSCPVSAIRITRQTTQAVPIENDPSGPFTPYASETTETQMSAGTVSAETVSAATADDASRMGRRKFTAATVGWLALTGSGAACLAGLTRFMTPLPGGQGSPRVAAGPLARYADRPAGSVVTDLKPKGIWIVRLEDRLVAMSTACPHLGCVLNWESNDTLFTCPCHGSGFDVEGHNLGGPAPTPMVRLGLAAEDGILYVDPSRTYRAERGQWQDPGSYWPLV